MPIPTTDNQRIQWTINFEAEFPAIATDFGFSNDETRAILDDSRSMRFVIENGQKAQAYSKASNSFKYDLLGSSLDGVSEPELPVYTGITPPTVISPRGVLKRMSKWEERLKAHPNYNQAVGDLLRINSAQGAAISLEDAKPACEGMAMADGVRIDWRKGKFDGVLVEGQRGDETAWAQLERDFRSPYTDERPPVTAGKPEERRYRLRYLLDDKPVGNWSDVISIISKP